MGFGQSDKEGTFLSLSTCAGHVGTGMSRLLMQDRNALTPYLLRSLRGGMPFAMREFLNGSDEIMKHGEKLPHWQQGEVMQFVTFRLGDAMPAAKLRIWKEEHTAWLSHHPQPWTPEQEEEYHRRFTWKLEGWLDEGAGSCILRDPANREALESVLMRFQGERVEHHSWVIMPNHVHLLFKPLAPLEKLM